MAIANAFSLASTSLLFVPPLALLVPRSLGRRELTQLDEAALRAREVEGGPLVVSAAPGESPQALPLEFHDVVVDGVPKRRFMPPRPTKVRQRADGDSRPKRDKRPLFDL